MTHREIAIRLAEAYIKAGQSIEADKIIKIADYFMAHTNDYTGYNTGTSWLNAIDNGSVSSLLYNSVQSLSSTANEATAKVCATNEDLNNLITANKVLSL